jgi:hypothetical protein
MDRVYPDSLTGSFQALKETLQQPENILHLETRESTLFKLMKQGFPGSEYIHVSNRPGFPFPSTGKTL